MAQNARRFGQGRKLEVFFHSEGQSELHVLYVFLSPSPRRIVPNEVHISGVRLSRWTTALRSVNEWHVNLKVRSRKASKMQVASILLPWPGISRGYACHGSRAAPEHLGVSYLGEHPFSQGLQSMIAPGPTSRSRTLYQTLPRETMAEDRQE